MLLRQSEATDDESDDSDYDCSYNSDCGEDNNVAVEELERYLGDESQLPELESCVIANAERRTYLIDLPDDPTTTVPPGVIPSHDDIRLRVVTDKGLLLLAYQHAPLDPAPGYPLTTRATSATSICCASSQCVLRDAPTRSCRSRGSSTTTY